MKIRTALTFLLASIYSISIAQSSSYYKVNKIVTVHKHYLIYVTRNDTIFKIVSKREKSSNCKSRIRKNMSYPLEFRKVNFLGGSEVDCVSFDKKTVICKEPDADLYIATNLKGLCLK